eukprot:TRINITY_DN19106_c0_g1_i1.p1 TRINITY_DN19106_c0_g1~~TRINITY_DN19106_c0_g1_i1.p1  ORF type:complete len:560 (+),score=84.35 TRINITY_DN19106_c0_g1_i1:76-1755(+)
MPLFDALGALLESAHHHGLHGIGDSVIHTAFSASSSALRAPVHHHHHVAIVSSRHLCMLGGVVSASVCAGALSVSTWLERNEPEPDAAPQQGRRAPPQEAGRSRCRSTTQQRDLAAADDSMQASASVPAAASRRTVSASSSSSTLSTACADAEGRATSEDARLCGGSELPEILNRLAPSSLPRALTNAEKRALAQEAARSSRSSRRQHLPAAFDNLAPSVSVLPAASENSAPSTLPHADFDEAARLGGGLKLPAGFDRLAPSSLPRPLTDAERRALGQEAARSNCSSRRQDLPAAFDYAAPSASVLSAASRSVPSSLPRPLTDAERRAVAQEAAGCNRSSRRQDLPAAFENLTPPASDPAAAFGRSAPSTLPSALASAERRAFSQEATGGNCTSRRRDLPAAFDKFVPAASDLPVAFDKFVPAASDLPVAFDRFAPPALPRPLIDAERRAFSEEAPCHRSSRRQDLPAAFANVVPAASGPVAAFDGSAAPTLPGSHRGREACTFVRSGNGQSQFAPLGLPAAFDNGAPSASDLPAISHLLAPPTLPSSHVDAVPGRSLC